MDRLKNEILSRIGPLKDLAKNLLELAWLLFAAYQWVIVFTILIGIPVSIIILFLPNADFSPAITINNELLYSMKAKVIGQISGLLYIGFACYYFFKMRKQPEPRLQAKFCIISLYICILLLLTAKAELAERQYILDNLRYSETTVKLYDADTKELLRKDTAISGISNTSSSSSSIRTVTSHTDKGWCVELLDIKPIELTFSVPGYKPQKVLAGAEEGEKTISVYLEKGECDSQNSL